MWAGKDGNSRALGCRGENARRQPEHGALQHYGGMWNDSGILFFLFILFFNTTSYSDTGE